MSILFPPKILNLRINTSIEQFFNDLETYFKMLKWHYIKPTKVSEFHWKSPDLEIRSFAFHPDDSIKTIQYALYIPGVKELKENKMVLSYTHIFRIELPREYPARVDKIKIFAESSIFHPRFASSGWGEGCIHINGEIDRILMDMIFQVLCEPDRIRPPKLYSDSDFGTNSTAMKWYQANPQEIYKTLLKEWELFRNKKMKISKTKIVEESTPTTTSKGFRIID